MTKHVISLFALLLFVFTLQTNAQVDNPHMPKPGPAPKAALPEYEEATLENGLKVILVTESKQPLVRFRLMFKSGAEYDPNGSGEASFTAGLLTKGTKNRTALEFAKESDFLGINVGAGSSDDDMNMFGSGLKKHMDKILDMMSDALLNPTFPQDELDKMAKQTINGLKTAEKSPEAISGRLEITVGYNQHPYSMFQTEETVAAITRDALVEFHKKYYIPNNASLAVIGDVTMDDALPLIKKYFSNWKKGDVPKRTFPEPTPIKGKQVHLVDLGRTQSQTQIQVMTTGMQRNNPDYLPMSLANSILGGGFSGRLFQNLRETHSFTYGAYSSMDSRRDCGLWSASSSVRRAATDSAIVEIMNEMRRMQNEPVSEEELQMHKQYASGVFLLSLENPGTMASRIQAIDLYGLPKDYYNNFVPNLMKVTTADVQRVAKKYMDTENAAITAVGDANEIKPALERIAPVKMYDIYMNPLEEQAEMDVDIDAKTLLNKHIDAIGGRKALEKIKDRTMEGSVTLAAGPQTFDGEVVEVRALPNKVHSVNVLTVQGNAMTDETWSNGETVHKSSMMGGSGPVEGEELLREIEENHFNEILRIDELGFKVNVADKSVADGRTVYFVDVKRKHSEETWLIDAETFLLVGTIKSISAEGQTAEIKTMYSDFREVDGVKLPHKWTMHAGMATIETKVSSYKHNTNPPDTEFTKN